MIIQKHEALLREKERAKKQGAQAEQERKDKLKKKMDQL